MSNCDRTSAAPGAFADNVTAVDAGLRPHMLRVYNYMAISVGLTGCVAMLTYRYTSPALLQSPLMWVFMLAPLGLVFISARINTLSAEAGATISGPGRIVALDNFPCLHRGLDHACVLHLGRHLRSAQHLGLHHPTRLIGIRHVPAYGCDRHCDCERGQPFLEVERTQLDNLHHRGRRLGLTAYDTQRIKGMYDPNESATSAGRKAVMGALSLYFNFINLFMMLLRLAGNRR
jgi:hypothetical protein